MGPASPWYWLLATLATWRVTHLFHAEAGPFDLLTRLRSVGEGRILGRLFRCFYCLSLWVSVVPAVALGRSPGEGMLLWLAISAGAIGVDRLIGLPVSDRPIIIEEEEN